jgi:outer membrane protein OmpA-like peptidoglycan-associated protein
MKTLNIFKPLLVGLLLVALGIPIYAQNILQKAKELQSNFAYAEAAELYQKQFETRTPSLEEARNVAACYLMMSDTRNAGEWYARVVNYNNRTARDIVTYAQVLKSEGKYEEAIEQFGHAELVDPSFVELSKKETEACQAAIRWIANPEFFEIANAAQYNSAYSEFSIIPFGKDFLIASDRRQDGAVYSKKNLYEWTGNPYVKLFAAAGADQPAFREVAGLNNQFHNGPAVIDESRREIFFTRTKQVKVKKGPVNSDPTSWYTIDNATEYIDRLELYSAIEQDGKWASVTPFAYNNAEAYNVGHAALSPDGKILYFVSDMPGGYGAADIYFSQRNDDGSWSTPRNAGASINTSGKEVFPSVGDDGTLYFSSDGHLGMGGLDLFRASGRADEWSVVENMKVPFNSPKDDFSLYMEPGNQSGFLSSNRDGGKGLDDIYRFNFAPPTRLVLAVKALQRLSDGTVTPLPEAKVSVELKQGPQLFESQVNQHGLIYGEVACNSSYLVEGNLYGYVAGVEIIGTPPCLSRNDTVYAEIVFDKLELNKPIVLKDIYYDYDKYFIRKEAETDLDKIVELLTEYPGIIIELGSHTDARGNTQYNEALSQKRAEAAVAYIISKGVDPRRIIAKGYGERMPVNGCVDGSKCTEEEYQMNRRTEFIIRGNL